MRLHRTLTVGAALAIVGCSSAAGSPCADVAKRAVQGFAEAMNSGDAALADGLFSETDFVWFSETPGRLDADTADRDTLLGYLAGRIAEGPRSRW